VAESNRCGDPASLIGYRGQTMPMVDASPLPDAASRLALVACCGYYCGGCGAHLIGRCEGCRQSARLSGCKVRACCLSAGYTTCAECAVYPDPRTCPVYLDSVNGSSGSLLRARRAACIDRIRKVGLEVFAREMVAAHRPALHS
jgi:hypothetical protein